ncbi:BACON domain-containing protein [Porphyromonas pogonae]|uniref:BACON domain-containing protein n=1 Tax=Porphyromonas pogonae TaxID=867595 RepID=UPI002E796378|nr:BACON domain-containing protein [Porphyromonas pogonae]
MKSKLQFLLGLMTMMFFVSSCSEDNSYEEASLKVSENTMQFTKEASEKVLSIQTNKSQWVAMSPQEGSWIELVQEGSNLKVKVTPNTLGMERKGVIMITSGDAAVKVEVKQSAADIILGTTPEDLKISSKGGEMKVEISSNSKDLKVETDGTAEWLSVKYVAGQSTFVLSAKENKEKTDRMAKVIVTAGKVIKEVKVIQAGIPYYILPLLQYPASLVDVAAFEKERDGILIKTPDGLFNRTAFRFGTTSKVMPFLEYNFDENAPMYKNAVVVSLDAKVMQGAEFDQFMTSNGFVKGAGDKTKQLYTNEKMSFTALVMFPSTGGAQMLIQYIPKQPKPYETFKTFPLEKQLPWLADRTGGVHGQKQPIIEAYEKTTSSVLDENISKKPEFYWYNLNATEKPLLARAYWFIKAGGDDNIPANDPFINELEATRVIANNINLAFWEFSGGYMMTNEFKALVEKEGFEYKYINKGTFIFYNKAKTIVLAAKPVKFKDYNNGEIVLDLQAFKMKLKESSVAQFMNYKKHLSSQNNEMDVIMKKLKK